MDQRRVNAVAANTFVTNPNLRQSVNFKDDALRPYYGWGSLNAVETLAYSRYDAMMVRLSRRFANNLAVNFNYTRSSARICWTTFRQHHQSVQHARAGQSRLRSAERIYHRLHLRHSEGEGRVE